MMLVKLKNIVIQLADGIHLAFEEAQDIVLECTEGSVWLTVERLPGDFLLSSGESICINVSGKAIVQGLPSASFRLTQTAEKASSRNRLIANRFDPSAWLRRYVSAYRQRVQVDLVRSCST